MGIYGETIAIDSPLFMRLSGDAAVLSQALLMRLDTRRGAYWDDPSYGLMVDDYLNAGLTTDALAQVASEIKTECEKDERVSSVEVTPNVTREDGGYSMRPEIRVFPVSGPPFVFTGPVYEFTGPTLRKVS